MKRYLFVSVFIISIALLFASFQTDFFLGFVNVLGAVSIFLLIVSGFVFLERLGYFDVFGYTFKKTFLVLSNKSKDLDGEEKERMISMYNYTQAKQEQRTPHAWMFYVFSFTFQAISALLSWIYVILKP